MYQPWLFGSLLAAGSGLVALTVTLQRAPTTSPALPEPSPVAVHVVPPPAVIAEPEPASPVLELAPLVIEAHKSRVAARPPEPAVTEPAEPAPAAERPCSEWRPIGPAHVVAGTPSGDVGVRELCM